MITCCMVLAGVPDVQRNGKLHKQLSVSLLDGSIVYRLIPVIFTGDDKVQSLAMGQAPAFAASALSMALKA